jgi:hypothetical protein
MEPTRFFYSTDGTDAHGPVTEDDLRKLYDDDVLGPKSFLCIEGQMVWKPIKIAADPAPAPPPLTPKASPAPPPLPRPGKHAVQESWENGVLTTVFNILAGVVATAGVIGSVLITALSHHGSNGIESISYQFGAGAGSVFFIVFFPYLVSLYYKGPVRVIVRTVGIIAIAFLVLGFQLFNYGNDARMLTQEIAIGENMKQEARAQIAAKGYYEGDPTQTEQKLQELKDQATGDTDIAKSTRDLVNVMNDIFAKVNVSREAEAACDFKVNTIISRDDIARRRSLIAKLRNSQADVLNYLQNFDSHCRDALSKENLSPDFVDGAISGARKSGHLDLLITLWQTQVKLSDDYVARLDYLSQTYGTWSFRDGKLVLPNDAAANTYNGLVKALQDDGAQLSSIQKQIFQ